MTKRIIKLVLLWATAAALLSGNVTLGAERVPRTQGPAVRLFNGTNLLGWSSWLVDTRRANPRGVFGVTNGMIRIFLQCEGSEIFFRTIELRPWTK